MRIQFEIKEKFPEIIEEIMNSEKWQTSVKEELSGRTTVVIRDQAYGSEATIEIYATSIEIKTAWSKYSYRIFVANDIVWCEYNGAYRGLLEQVLLPTITPKENLLNSDVTESSLYGNEHKKLREYAEDNLIGRVGGFPVLAGVLVSYSVMRYGQRLMQIENKFREESIGETS